MENEKKVTAAKKLRLKDGLHAVVEPEITEFPLEIFIQKFSDATYQLIDWHWHTGVQFSYVTKNSVQFRILDSVIILEAGAGLFINAQQVHSAFSDDCNGEYISLNIPVTLFGLEGSEMYRRFMEPVIQKNQLPFLVFEKSEETENIRNLLAECCGKISEHPKKRDLQILADLFLIWDELLKFFPRQTIKKKIPDGNQRLQKILEYLNENYKRKISLEEIAAEVHLSRSECSRFFQKVTGQPLFKYLTRLRLKYSMELLLKTDKTITEIAYETGFRSQSYFDQKFRNETGVSPRQFREKE